MRLIGDLRLLDLGLTGGAACKAAGILLRCQIRTAKQTGHVLDLSDRPVLEQIRRAARQGQTPNLSVRCVRCNAQQLLPRWLLACDMTAEGRALLAERNFAQDTPDLEYLWSCSGDLLLQDALEILGQTAEG